MAYIRSNQTPSKSESINVCQFPYGNNGGTDEHVSVYLLLESTGSLSAGNGVNAIFKFFLFDQIRGNYVTAQGRAHRFDRLKCEWGFDKFISLEDFEEPTNGYQLNDTVFFGVEVFVSEGSRIGECHSISPVDNISNKYKWVITEFSELGEHRYSDVFVVGGYKWKLLLYPDGHKKHRGSSLSMYLVHVDSKSSTTEHKVNAEFVLTLNDQFNQNHIQKKTIIWFGASIATWGWPSFIELKDLKDDKNGYIVSDRCMIEAEVTVLCETTCDTLKC